MTKCVSRSREISSDLHKRLRKQAAKLPGMIGGHGHDHDSNGGSGGPGGGKKDPNAPLLVTETIEASGSAIVGGKFFSLHLFFPPDIFCITLLYTTDNFP